MKKFISFLLVFAFLVTLASCSNSEVIENSSKQEVEEIENDENGIYIVNTKTKKYHSPVCSSIREISEEHRRTVSDIASLTERGYSPCSKCILR